MDTRCVICQAPITYQYFMCRSCIATYGWSRDGWPEWLRFLVRDEQRIRYDQKIRQKKEYPVSSFRPSMLRILDSLMYGKA